MIEYHSTERQCVNSFEKTTDFFQKPFDLKKTYFWLILFSFLLIRIIWSIFFPMANDEVYYWEWARSPQLSYVDAPPFVAWQGFLGNLFFDNSLGVRFFLPFFYLISTLFLLFSANKLASIQNKLFTNEMAYSVIILTQLIPVFTMEGFILLPDNGLLFGISGSLYFLLSAISKQQRKQLQQLPIKYAIFAGFFIGIAGLSKYHALPISLGFFLSIVVYRGFKKSVGDIPFWLLTIISSLLIVSPVFIWNIEHQFASFHFQSQHGFAGFSFNLKGFSKFLLGTIFYLYPWFFLAFFIFIIQNLKRKKYLNSINNIVIFPFLILFIIIFISAMGKQALPHWTMPGFFLLIPAFAIQWHPLTNKHFKKWKVYLKISLITSVLLPTILCFDQFNQFLIRSYVFFKGNADDLFQVYAWKNLQYDLKKQALVDIETKPFNPYKLSCKGSEFVVGSLKWYWTAQMAFHFQNQPKIYNFDFINTSFYLWRDNLPRLANCNIIILGSKDHFDQNLIEEVMDIHEKKEIHIYPYLGENIIYLKGRMKEETKLKEIYEKQIKQIKF
ncbi:glycosyltransferase family 39 protein [Pigmentibacter sp. JX0631]|uniref:ArnT family glycosyltransferase n=1 Tax=Pigmentibacter sp. JX0631 TaxID=2976982 RepID=UPI0024682A22|nr:glycosyltransferase family 39 protein [Pigmentibacter sp. JX0631]WGL59955.1 glycosyltransferase family 39 protein [Pigmentibacter sp. JX0631]